VCPWNGPKLVRLTRERGYLTRHEHEHEHEHGGRLIPGTAAPRLLDLMAMDEAGWDGFSRGSAIRRAKRAGFLRNVAG
jgi:epoxyqueuosine reductase QueG